LRYQSLDSLFTVPAFFAQMLAENRFEIRSTKFETISKS